MKEKSEIEWTNEQIPLGKVPSLNPSTSALVHDGADDEDGSPKRINKSSRDLIFDDALKSLDTNNNMTQMIALCGMGGVGKTTMMEQLKKVAENKKMFDWIVKVVVGKDRNPTDVQQTVAEYIGQPLTETDKDARAERLQKRFEGISEDGKKNILVILDDVWELLELKDIGLASPLPKGFKLLVTSREEQICTQMGVGTSSIFRIVVLQELEARKLFWEIAGPVSDGDDPDLHQIGDRIVTRCGGLPIAIKTIASSLCGNIKDAWEDAVFRLQNRKFSVVDVFEISYDNLKEEDERQTFLLCGLFPEDYNIHVEDLVRYGWGLKLFENINTSIAIARRRVNTCVNNLIRSNLLIKSDLEGCVKMHDLMRDFVLSKFSEVKQASIMNHDDYMLARLKEESYERILFKCGGMVEFPVDFDFPNLTFLKLMGGNEVLKFPEDFDTKMEKLEVLAYESIHPLWPPRYSTSLRTLCLRSCSLVHNISFIGDLINLEVLSFADCIIDKLPSTIGKLKKLRLLYLTGCDNLCIDDGVLQDLNKLEELYMGAYYKNPIRFTNANFDELRILMRQLSALEFNFRLYDAQPKLWSFKKLERFKISVRCSLKDEKDMYSYKNTLKLFTSRRELLECKFNELFRKTEILHLQVNDMNHLEDVSMHPYQHTFCNLKVLSISECAELTCLFASPLANGLMQLESLRVLSCPILESIVRGENSGNTVIIFPKLKLLALERLPMLVSLCDNVNLMELPQLVELELSRLPNFTSIFTGNNTNVYATQPFFNKEVVTPPLEKLKISFMEKLKEIWPCEIEEELTNISMLKEIVVKECASLMNLFPINPMRLLSHLEELVVSYCGSIEVLFNINLDKTEQPSSSSSLRILRVGELEKLREVFRIKDENNSGLVIRGFQEVELIEIIRCRRFRNIVTPAAAKFDLKAVTRMAIYDCGEESQRNNVELVKNSREQEINAISKEETSNNKSIIAFPSFHLVHTFYQLREIYLNSCFEGMKVVFEIESGNRELVTTTQQLVILPYLQELELTFMETLTHVWKCNWNKFLTLEMKQQPQSSSFQNLKTIEVRGCHSMKYLFSPLMAKLLSNLKNITIWSCDGMEEVVSKRDDEHEETSTYGSTHLTTSLFPHLDVLELTDLRNLKHIGGGDIHDQFKLSQVGAFSWSLCQYSRNIILRDCKVISSLIPSYATFQMQKVVKLEITDCDSMVEIFETKEINNSDCSRNANVDQGSSGNTLAIPRSKNFTKHKLSNLKKLKIKDCDHLQYVFTFSTLKSLRQLEELSIKRCKAIQVIVREENEEQTKEIEVIIFPRLKSVKLYDLPNLGGFFFGTNDFQWPLLDFVVIENCPRMSVFTCGQLKCIYTNLGKHNKFRVRPTLHQASSSNLDTTSFYNAFIEGSPWPFHIMIEMKVQDNHKLKKILTLNELLQTQNLEKIDASLCDQVEEVFELALGATNTGFNESQTVIEFPKLRDVELWKLESVKCIWKNKQWRKLEFPNLTRVSIYHCDSLKGVFTFSMVGSLMQLQELHVTYCKNMEIIFREEEEEEGKCDVKVSEIKLPCLKSLQLRRLPNLKGFCLGNENFSLPSLNTLTIIDCPRVAVFTNGRVAVPELKQVGTGFRLEDIGEDINSFLMSKTREEE